MGSSSDRGRRRAPRGGRARGVGLRVRWTPAVKLGALAAGLLCLGLGAWVGGELATPPVPDLAALVTTADPTIAAPVVVPPSPDTAEAPREPAPRRGTDRPSSGAAPRVALVIDDLGRSVHDLERLRALGVPLTYAVLPFEPRTPEVVAALRDRGAEFLLHLPMEPANGADPGPGALTSAMDDAELAAATARALDAVPGAAGVNNHMGSAMSPRREAMAVVLRVIDGRGLYFLDSRTSAETAGYEVARELGMPAAERQVFLDNERDPAAIREQFRRLLEIARERGSAVGIAHPYPETFESLAAAVPEARAAGIEFVTAGSVLDG